MSDKRHRQSPKEKFPTGKLLLISYFFPPTAGGGVFRPLAMAKHLSKLGWEITVLCATTPKHYPVDEELRKQIPPEVKIVRYPVVWEGSWFRRLLGKIKLDTIPKNLVAPDERIFWAEKACNEARKLIKEDGCDIIYTTGPPFSILLLGLWLKRMKDVNLPWVAEFRDPWSISPYLSMPNPNHRRVASETESDLMKLAERIIMVTPTFAERMREKYPEAKNKVRCVQNGFDEDDFIDLPVKDQWHNDYCTVLASGTVFGRNNMNDFVEALDRIKKNDRESWEKMRVVFQGLPDTNLNRALLEKGLTGRCESRGFVTHAENIRDLWTADLLVLPISPAPNSDGHIPSRTYEYLASGTPVLAICQDGDLAKLLEGFPHVSRVEPGNIDGIVECLMDSVSDWEKSIRPDDPDPNSLRGLTRKSRAKEMDTILKELLDEGRKSE